MSTSLGRRDAASNGRTSFDYRTGRMGDGSQPAPKPIELRLAEAAGQRLGVVIEFCRWDIDAGTGAHIPVFYVSDRLAAEAAGLRVAKP